MKSIRIFIGSLETGGTEKHLAYVLPGLVKSGWEIRVILLSTAELGFIAKKLQMQNVVVETIVNQADERLMSKLPHFLGRFYRLVICIKRLYKEFKTNPSSMAYFLLPGAYIVGMCAAYLSGFSGYKIMGRRSLNNYQSRRFLMKMIEPKIHVHCDAFIANSQAIVKQLIQEESVRSKQVFLIYNGVNTLSLQRKQCYFDKQDLTFVIVANFIPYKGHIDLLEAFGLVKQEMNLTSKSWQLICVGKDNKGILVSLQKKADALGIAKNVKWLTSCDDVPKLLASIDVGILSSHEEGFSNAILEYMSAGLPCIVTDVGGNPEAVIDEETGFVVPPKNPRAMADAILKLVRNPELIEKFGDKGYKRVLEHFSLERCVKSYNALFEALYQKRRPLTNSDFTLMAESS